MSDDEHFGGYGSEASESIGEINAGGADAAAPAPAAGDGGGRPHAVELVPAPLPGNAATMFVRAPPLEETCFLCRYNVTGPGADRMRHLFMEAQHKRQASQVYAEIQCVFNKFASSEKGMKMLPVEDRTWSLQCIQQHAESHCYADSVDRALTETVVVMEDMCG